MKLNKKIIYLIIIVVLLFCWQYFGSTNDMVRLLISYPSLIGNYFLSNAQDLIEATGITLYESVIGLIIATVFSFGVMILCFYKPKIMDFILPVMVTSQVIPLIVLAPFFIILLGIGLTSKIAMAALMCFFPIFVNFAQGYKIISKNIHELMFTYNAPKSFTIFNVYFPLSMPSIIAGLKISATLAVIGAIVAEFNGADLGLGKNLYLSAKRLEPELMMTSLILSTIIGFLLFYIVKIIEVLKGEWYHEK